MLYLWNILRAWFLFIFSVPPGETPGLAAVLLISGLMLGDGPIGLWTADEFTVYESRFVGLYGILPIWYYV
jgi:hypothetical protein